MGEASHVKPRDETKGMKTFLNEAFTSKDLLRSQRMANRMARQKQGKHAPYGLAMEDILYEKQRMAEASSNVDTEMQSRIQMAASYKPVEVVKRDPIKHSSNAILTRKRLEQKRKQKKEEAERLALESAS